MAARPNNLHSCLVKRWKVSQVCTVFENQIQQRSPLIDDRDLYEEFPMRVVQGRGKVEKLRKVLAMM